MYSKKERSNRSRILFSYDGIEIVDGVPQISRERQSRSIHLIFINDSTDSQA